MSLRYLLILCVMLLGITQLPAESSFISKEVPGLSDTQETMYLGFEEKIEEKFKDKIANSNTEQAKDLIKKHQSFRTVWQNILEMQVKINEIGTSLNSEEFKSNFSYTQGSFPLLRRLIGRLVANWEGEKRVLESLGIDARLPPLNAASWVWETNPIIHSLIQSYFRENSLLEDVIRAFQTQQS